MRLQSEELQFENLADGLFVTDSDEDREVTAIMDALSAVFRTVTENLSGSAQHLRMVVEEQREILAKSAWQTAVDQAVDNYNGLVTTLRIDGVDDPSEYSHFVQERQRLNVEVERLESMVEERNRLVNKSQSLLEEVLKARRVMSNVRDTFLAKVLAQNSFVRIQNRTYGVDPRVIERSLRDVLGVTDNRFENDILVMENERPIKGIVKELLADLPTEPAPRRLEVECRIDGLKQRFIAACFDNGEFGGFFNNYLASGFKRTPVFLDKLLSWFPEDSLQVEYSRSGNGKDFWPIDQASAGQRSAAMLAFLLAHGEEPLVLDQPEDDLDNHLIYDLIVRQIRENKLRRQIIVVTHNPNIVVNGDAEMLHAFEFRLGQCIVAQSGSLQEKAMREEVCRVMEGGREAFERRYRRLGPEPKNV